MSIIEVVTNALAAWPTTVAGDNGEVCVKTHCLYPSNGVVTVFVGPGVGSYLVHDGWGAIEELSGAGGKISPGFPAKVVRHLVSTHGLLVGETGLIKAEGVAENDLLSTIILVANASKDAANDLLSHFRPRLRRNLRAELASLLEVRFPNHVVRNHIVVGASNKPHRFDSVVRLSGDKQLILDAVTSEASSINAALVAHLDVRNARLPNVEQRIFYDDDERWSAADLSLLKIGAPPVPFSRAAEVLERLAA